MRAEFIERGDFIRIISRIPEKYKVALLFSLETGLRVSDVLTLTYAEALWGQPHTEHKTGKMVVLSCPAYLREVLLSWFARDTDFNDKSLVFESDRKPGVPVHRSTLYRHLREAAKKAGRHISPHTARKIFAVEAFRRSGSLAKVKEALRHDREDTTALYAFSDRL